MENRESRLLFDVERVLVKGVESEALRPRFPMGSIYTMIVVRAGVATMLP
jgi:hypothetical protein